MAAVGMSPICYNHPEKRADFKCFDCKYGKFFFVLSEHINFSVQIFSFQPFTFYLACHSLTVPKCALAYIVLDNLRAWAEKIIAARWMQICWNIGWKLWFLFRHTTKFCHCSFLGYRVFPRNEKRATKLCYLVFSRALDCDLHLFCKILEPI